jgi:hypothetical protein
VFENRVLKRIFAPKRDEMVKGWRKLHNEGLRNLYSSPSIIRMKLRRLRWIGHAWERQRDAQWVSVGKPEGTKSPERPKRRWEDNIKIDLGELGCGWHDLDSSGSG